MNVKDFPKDTQDTIYALMIAVAQKRKAKALEGKKGA